MDDHDYVFPPQSANDHSDILIRLLRLTFAKLKVTVKDLKQCHKNYFYNILLKTDKVQEISSFGNMKKNIGTLEITWKLFLRTLTVLGLDVVKVDITFRHKGQQFVISSKGRIDENDEYTDSPL